MGQAIPEEAGTTVTLVPESRQPGARLRRQAGGDAASYLVVIEGPPGPVSPVLELLPDRAPLMIGRHEACDLRLQGAEQVSRRHARLTYRAPAASGEEGTWLIADVGSSWGTFLNGRRLQVEQEMPLRPGDQVRLTPWTFRFGDERSPQGLHVAGDDGVQVRKADAGQLAPLQADRLSLLLSGSAALHDAVDEQDLARRLLELARQGTRLANAVVLRPLDRDDRYEILAQSTPGDADAGSFRFSRSLLADARGGNVAEVRVDDTLGGTSQSIVQMQITRALCVPILLGQSPRLFLYLDQRGDTLLDALARDQENALAFCVALSKMASLALSNLKRVEMERRAAEIDAELQAAAAAQKWILPRRQVEAGGFRILGESRPGRGVGGDFFDLIELGSDRLAVALGDVSGKGVAAGVLMTATQGFLHALLADVDDLAKVTRQLNEFVFPRRPGNRFVTLWIGLFDRSADTLTYVDAGHGLAIGCDAQGQCQPLTSGGGLPIGIMEDADYTAHTTHFGPGNAALVVSDGIVEQPTDGATYEDRDEFGLERTRHTLTASLAGPDPIRDLFDAVIRHAGTARLADDATAVLVRR